MASQAFNTDDLAYFWYSGRQTNAGTGNTHWKWEGLGSSVRFAIKGNVLKIVHNCINTAGLEISVDGGAFSVVTTTNSTTLTSPVTSANILPGSPTDDWHDIELRMSNGYSGNFYLVKTGGVIVEGADPQVRAFTNAPGASFLKRNTDAIFSNGHNFLQNSAHSNNYPSSDDWLVTGARNESSTAIAEVAMNGYIRWRGDGSKVWYFGKTDANNWVRLYVDGCQYGDRKALAGTAGSATTPGYQWDSLDLPNDGQNHEFILVCKGGLDKIGVTGAATMEASANVSPMRVAFFGHSHVEANAATNHNDATSNYDIFGIIACDDNGTPILHMNRGRAGMNATNALSPDHVTLNVQPFDPDLIVIDLAGNDETAAGVTSPDSRDPTISGTLAYNYATLLQRMLTQCPRATIRWMHPPQTITTNRTRLLECIDAAVAYMGSTRVSAVTADAGWTHSAGLRSDTVHAYPGGIAEAFGLNTGCLFLSGQPSGGDTFTLTLADASSVVFTFDAGSHGASPNPVTIGADVYATCLALFNKAVAVLGRSRVYSYTSVSGTSPVQNSVHVHGVTALAKSGTNLAVYKNTLAGTGGHGDKILDAVQDRTAFMFADAVDVGVLENASGMSAWSDADKSFSDDGTAATASVTGMSGPYFIQTDSLDHQQFQCFADLDGRRLTSVKVNVRYKITATSVPASAMGDMGLKIYGSLDGSNPISDLVPIAVDNLLNFDTSYTTVSSTITDRATLDAMQTALEANSLATSITLYVEDATVSSLTFTLHIDAVWFSDLQTEEAPAATAASGRAHRRLALAATA